MDRNTLGEMLSLSPEEMEELHHYIVSQSEKISGNVLKEALEKYGMENNFSLGVAIDILSQATGRVASILASFTGKGEVIIDRIADSIRENMDSFEKYVRENVSVAVEKEN